MNTPTAAAALRAEADSLEAKAQALRDQASEIRRAELKAQPLAERLIFAAYARCQCGAGMAYDPASDGDGVFKGPNKWECSAILTFNEVAAELRPAIKAAVHSSPLPFAFYEVKSENQPSANGQTTRPPAT